MVREGLSEFEVSEQSGRSQVKMGQKTNVKAEKASCGEGIKMSPN